MVQFKKVEELIKESWDKRTCHPEDKEKWSSKKPEQGQCGVSVLVIQDYFGGEIAFNRKHRHVWNILPNGTKYDIAKDLFPAGTKIEKDGVITRNNMFYSQSAKKTGVKRRYDILAERVQRKLQEERDAEYKEEHKNIRFDEERY